MQIYPVKIQITDNKKFGDVAFLVDRDDFLEDLFQLRQKWKAMNPLPRDPKKPWFTFPWGLTRKQMETYSTAVEPLEKELYDLNKLWNMRTKNREKLLRKYIKAERLLPSNDFRFDISGLRKKYKRSTYFDLIIACALLYDQVTDEDYVCCELKIIYPEMEFLQYFEDPELVITFSPLAKSKEIKQKFTEQNQKIIKKYENNCLGGKVFKTDTISNIRRDREWYWLNKNGLSYDKIWVQEEGKGRPIIRDGVAKAIAQYRRRLTVEL